MSFLLFLFIGSSLHAKSWPDVRVDFNQAFQASQAAKPACNTFHNELKTVIDNPASDPAELVALIKRFPPLPEGTLKSWEITMKDDFPASAVEARILLDKLQQVTVCENAVSLLVTSTRTIAKKGSAQQKKEFAQAVLSFLKSESLKPNAMIVYMTYLSTLKAMAEENLIAKKWLAEITSLRALAKKEEDLFFTRFQVAQKSHDPLMGLQVVRDELLKVQELETGLQKKVLSKLK